MTKRTKRIETYSTQWSVYVQLPGADYGFEMSAWRDTAAGAEAFARRLYPNALLVHAS